ncbi:hypothetical protein BH11PSE8_BH11PSE8_11030 [soil metagenome]
MNFQTFIDTGWADHNDNAPAVAERLAQSLHVVTLPEHVLPFARLTTHVYGEHLARWEDGVALLESLRASPAWEGSPAQAGAVNRGVATLRHCSGSTTALDDLSLEDRITVLATAALAFVGQKATPAAIEAYAQAMALAAATPLLPGSPAVRALAAGGNNLAAELSEKSERNAAQIAGMLAAAEGGLKYWKQAGTWLEEERAEYMLSMCLRKAGDAEAAIEHAARCIAICVAHDAPAFEGFFGHAALAMARREAHDIVGFDESRDAALGCHAHIDPAEQHWCASELSALGIEASAPPTRP